LLLGPVESEKEGVRWCVFLMENYALLWERICGFKWDFLC
jgi:hypothetical protein